LRQICLERERLGAATGLRAVILAGGKGTRLALFTINFPKPLVPIGDVPVLEILLWRLVQHGITDVTLCLGHLAELIKAYLDHRKELREKIRFQFVEEDEPTGTAGSLSLVPGLTGSFLGINARAQGRKDARLIFLSRFKYSA
jgi:NDP-sugar pyrophosphorylase family protein